MTRPGQQLTMPPTRVYRQVSPGDALPELVIPITRTLVVAGAIASRDYQDVHHDSVLARERGSKDIFMNILTTNGLVGRYVTDWTGPGGRLHDVHIRLGAPSYPDDVMTMTGTVTACSGSDGNRGVVELAIRGANSLGDHVTGTVVVSLPLDHPVPGAAGTAASVLVGPTGVPGAAGAPPAGLVQEDR